MIETNETQSDSGLVLATTFTTIMNRLRLRHQVCWQELADVFQASTEASEVDRSISEPIIQWCRAPEQHALDLSGSAADCQAILHVFYVWLCRKIGPADIQRSTDLKGVRSLFGSLGNSQCSVLHDGVILSSLPCMHCGQELCVFTAQRLALGEWG